MKRSLALAAILAVVFSSAAFAGVQDFGKFTVDVVQGCTAENQDGTAIITKNDSSAQLTIAIADAGGSTKAQLAEAFISEFKKSGTYTKITAPEADSDGSYSWEMTTAEGVVSNAMLAVEDGKCKLVVMTGLDTAGGEMAAMLETIKEK